MYNVDIPDAIKTIDPLLCLVRKAKLANNPANNKQSFILSLTFLKSSLFKFPIIININNDASVNKVRNCVKSYDIYATPFW